MTPIDLTRRPLKPQYLGLSFLLLSVQYGGISAQERVFAPADFGTPNRLASLEVSRSDLPRDISALAVRCQAFIETSGSVGTFYCDSDDSYAHRKVISSVIDAIPDQTFVPAQVNNENVRVLMNFAVFVDCSADACVTLPVRNHGYRIGELGLDYVAPQPILPQDDWYEGFDYKLSWINDWMPHITGIRGKSLRKLRYIVETNVTEDGEPGDSCVYWAPGQARLFTEVVDVRLLQRVKGAVASMDRIRYIPGFSDGQPVSAKSYEDTLTTRSAANSLFPDDIRCSSQE